MTADTFGEKLTKLRKLAGESQVEMAHNLKALFPEMRITQTSLSVLEHRQDAPREIVVAHLAEYFGVSEEHFINPGYENERLEQWRAFKTFKVGILRRLDAFERAILNDRYGDSP